MLYNLGIVNPHDLLTRDSLIHDLLNTNVPWFVATMFSYKSVKVLKIEQLYLTVNPYEKFGTDYQILAKSHSTELMKL